VSVVPVEQALELTRLTQSHFDQFQATIAQQKNAWLQQQHDNRVASAGPALSDLDASAWRLALARAMGENESIAAGKRQQELKDVHRIVAAIKQARQATKEYELQRQGKASRTLSIRRRSKKSSSACVGHRLEISTVHLTVLVAWLVAVGEQRWRRPQSTACGCSSSARGHNAKRHNEPW